MSLIANCESSIGETEAQQTTGSREVPTDRSSDALPGRFPRVRLTNPRERSPLAPSSRAIHPRVCAETAARLFRARRSEAVAAASLARSSAVGPAGRRGREPRKKRRRRTGVRQHHRARMGPGGHDDDGDRADRRPGLAGARVWGRPGRRVVENISLCEWRLISQSPGRSSGARVVPR